MKTFLCLVFLLSSQLAFAQTPPATVLPTAENSKLACQDHIDNDGDGHVDCDDQDCGDFVFCARTSTSDQTQLRALRGKAATQITLGSILFSVGAAMLAASGGIWWATGSNSNPTRSEAAAVALSVDVVGFAMLASGIVIIPLGAGNRARATTVR